ncbi:MAG: caspase family protein [Candidatus Nitrosopolaris sp.]
MSEEPRKKALIIAISKYDDEDLTPLEFCRNDREKMYELLKSQKYDISEKNKLVGEANWEKIRNTIYDFFC